MKEKQLDEMLKSDVGELPESLVWQLVKTLGNEGVLVAEADPNDFQIQRAAIAKVWIAINELAIHLQNVTGDQFYTEVPNLMSTALHDAINRGVVPAVFEKTPWRAEEKIPPIRKSTMWAAAILAVEELVELGIKKNAAAEKVLAALIETLGETHPYLCHRGKLIQATALKGWKRNLKGGGRNKENVQKEHMKIWASYKAHRQKQIAKHRNENPDFQLTEQLSLSWLKEDTRGIPRPESESRLA